jgi:iron(III) transport system ATP-binding protein
VADFVGLTNFIDATVVGRDDTREHCCRVDSSIGQLLVTSMDSFAKGDAALVSVRPEDVELCDHRPEGPNVIEATVDFKVFLGEYMDYQVRVGERQVLARVHPSFKVPVGGQVWLRLNPEKCISIPDTTKYAAVA